MTNRTQVLLRKEQMEVTLPILVEYYATSKQVKGCSKKTLLGLRHNLGKFIHFLQSRGHSLKLKDLTLHDARDYMVSLQGIVTKYKGHTLTPEHPNSTYSPETVHTHARALRGFSTWLRNEGYTALFLKPIICISVKKTSAPLIFFVIYLIYIDRSIL